MRPAPANRTGFTLVELLVAIIAILVAVLLPAVQSAREAARRLQCKNNLKQISLALQSYHDCLGVFPSGQYFCATQSGCSVSSSTAPGWSWSASILPYAEQANTYEQLDFRLSMADPHHTAILATPISLFHCPSDATRKDAVPPSGLPGFEERIATNNYCGNGGSFGFSFNLPWIAGDERITNGVLGRNSKCAIRDIRDGLTNTFIVGETIHYDFYWDPTLYGNYNPSAKKACCTLTAVRQGNWSLNPGFNGSQNAQRESFASLHPGGANFALCDGSVRFVSEEIENTSRVATAGGGNDPFDLDHGGADYGVWQRLFSRNDGLAISEF